MNVPRSDLRQQMAAVFGNTGGGVAWGDHQSATFSFSVDPNAREYLPGLVESTDDPDEMVVRYEHVFRFVSQSAWAITPPVLAVIRDMITYRVAGHRLNDDGLADRIGADRLEAARQPRRAAPRRVASGQVALMSLYGVIAPRASMVQSVSGPSGTGLDQFGAQLDSAAADPEVGSIVVDVNSPGGTVDMVPETAAKIREAAAQKPVYGVANTDAGSAAYWLLSQMTEVFSTPSGMVGSIGVYSMHQDVSVAQELQGKKTSLISAGKFKVEGNPFEALGPEARDAIQAVVNEYYDSFVADVALGRGVKADKVSAGYGEGRMLTAKAALAAGMIDRIATFEDVVQWAAKGSPASGPKAMSSADPVSLAGEEGVNPVDQYVHL